MARVTARSSRTPLCEKSDCPACPALGPEPVRRGRRTVVAPDQHISLKAYEHPADRAATPVLKALPMLDTVVRKLIVWRYERALRQSTWATRSKSLTYSCPSCGWLTPAAGGVRRTSII